MKCWRHPRELRARRVQLNTHDRRVTHTRSSTVGHSAVRIRPRLSPDPTPRPPASQVHSRLRRRWQLTFMPSTTSPTPTRARILVVDDDDTVRDALGICLRLQGYDALAAADAGSLEQQLEGLQPDVVLLDLQLPDGDGIDLLPIIKKQWPDTEIIVLTGHGTIQRAVEAVKAGAFYFLTKPLDPDTLLPLVQQACHRRQLQRTVPKLAGVFESPAMKEVLHLVRRIAPSDAAILITGESGCRDRVRVTSAFRMARGGPPSRAPGLNWPRHSRRERKGPDSPVRSIGHCGLSSGLSDSASLR